MPVRIAVLAVVGACGLAITGGIQATPEHRDVLCLVSEMRLSVGARWSEATGQNTATVVVTNPSDGPCVLRGYPTIILLDRAGDSLPFTYSHRGDQMITANRPSEIRIREGRAAYFAFNKYRCDIHATAVAATLRVALPGSDVFRSVRLPHYPIIDLCNERPSRIVTVSPIEPKLGGAAAHR